MSTDSQFRHVAILGPGLMGGSLGMALRRLPLPPHVAVWARRAETREAALRFGAADSVHESPAVVCNGADVVVICTPVSVVPQILKACSGSLMPGALVTDVAGVKAPVVSEADAIMADNPAMFVGSHPIAGAELQGLDAARVDLYQNAIVALTPSQLTRPDAPGRAKIFWESLGARVCIVSPMEHDRLLAHTSHLPHLAAAVLVLATAGAVPADGLNLGDFCGTGFRDTTRLAAGSPALWSDIVKTNSAMLARALRAFGAEAHRIAALVEAGDFDGVQTFLEDARLARARILAGRTGEP